MNDDARVTVTVGRLRVADRRVAHEIARAIDAAVLGYRDATIGREAAAVAARITAALDDHEESKR